MEDQHGFQAHDANQPAPANADRQSPPQHGHPKHRWAEIFAFIGLIATGAAALGHALGGVSGYFEFVEQVRGHAFSSEASNKSAHPVTVKEASLVVMPFDALGDERQQAVFADALTEDITSGLSRIPGLFVVPTGSSFTYKGQEPQFKEVRAQLGVGYALSGSVRRIDDAIRINAKLIDTNDGHQIWTDLFQGKLAELTDLEGEVTGRIVRSLDIQIARAAYQRGEKFSNPSAVELVLRGRAAWRGAAPSPQTFRDAAILYDQALAIDPNYVPALTGLSYLLATQVGQGMATDASANMTRVEDLLSRAKSLGADDEDVYLAAAVNKMLRKDPDAAIQILKQAIEIFPNSPPLLFWSALMHTYAGLADQAQPIFDRAMTLSKRDPQQPIWRHGISLSKLLTGHIQEAITIGQQAFDANDRRWISYVTLTASYALSGNVAKAKELLAQAKQEGKLQSFQWTDAHVLKWSDNPVFLAQRAEIFRGLQLAGLE